MIAWFARHQTAANLLMAAIMILGLTTLPGLQRETLPEIKNDKVQVQISYRGATPEEVEDAICRRLEDAIESVTDLEELRCEAREGIGTATAVMREGADMMRFMDDIKSEVDAIDDLPEETEPPVITEIGRTDAVVSLAVTGPVDELALKAYAEDLKDRLMAETAVAEVEVAGFSDHHIRIEVPAWRLRQYGLSAADIADAVEGRSLSTPAGRLEGGNEDLLLRFDDQRKRADAFRDLVVISGETGAAIRLGEIAAITDRFDRAEAKILFNGQRAAVLNINKTRDQDILELIGRIRAFVDDELAAAPAGVALHLSQDVASIVQDRLDMLLRNGAQGLALVFLILWLFFGLRYSFWVAMGLPVSFLGALFLMPIFGITINMISMVGLLIGVGLLMDDAIVIAENIAARRAAGDSPRRGRHPRRPRGPARHPVVVRHHAAGVRLAGVHLRRAGADPAHHAHRAHPGDLGQPDRGLPDPAPSPGSRPGPPGPRAPGQTRGCASASSRASRGFATAPSAGCWTGPWTTAT
jgi:HAE1 family hydrophobic/amphiphilic exporter-1